MRSNRFYPIALIVAVSGCLSLTEPAGSCGSFVGQAGGASTDSLSGCAFFSIDQVSGTFGLVLTNGGPDNTNPGVKLFRALGRPVAGTHQIGCAPAELCGFAFLGTRAFKLSGSFVVTASDSLGVSGSLDATGMDSLGTVLTVRGVFDASCKGQKRPFETSGDPNSNTEKSTPCKPSSASG